MCFKCFGSVFPGHLLADTADLGKALELWAAVSLALGVWGEETHFLKDSDTQGAGLDKAGEDVLFPTGFKGAKEEDVLLEGACGVLVMPFEDLSWRCDAAAGEFGNLERTAGELGWVPFKEEQDNASGEWSCFSLLLAMLTGVPGFNFCF